LSLRGESLLKKRWGGGGGGGGRRVDGGCFRKLERVADRCEVHGHARRVLEFRFGYMSLNSNPNHLLTPAHPFPRLSSWSPCRLRATSLKHPSPAGLRLFLPSPLIPPPRSTTRLESGAFLLVSTPPLYPTCLLRHFPCNALCRLTNSLSFRYPRHLNYQAHPPPSETHPVFVLRDPY
jgi:hypothetical protein